MAVTVRLDGPSQRALRALEASGLSRSEAVRRGLLRAAADLRRREDLRAEVADLMSDEVDRAEMREIAAFMEGLRAPW
jgi:Arc/MetJ-type ribon-helix-helix transcriptional regulator